MLIRDRSGRLLQEYRVGPVVSTCKEVSEILSVLLRTLSGYNVQHHNPPKDAFPHRQSHSSVRCHLFGYSSRLLHSGEFRGEDNNGNNDIKLFEHLLASRCRDQPSDFSGNAANRKIPSLHDGACNVFDHCNRLRIEYSLSIAINSRDVPVDSRTLSKRTSATFIHAETSDKASQVSKSDSSNL